MLGLGKKSLDLTGVAALIFHDTSKTVHLLDGPVDRLIVDSPSLAPIRPKILDELQWVRVAAGLMMVRLLVDHSVSRAVQERILSVYRAAVDADTRQPAFSPAALGELERRLEAYCVRFNRGLALRDGPPAETIYGAVDDVANEVMTYVTGKPRATAVHPDDMMALQQRTAPVDEIEAFVAHILRDSVSHFQKRFREFKIRWS